MGLFKVDFDINNYHDILPSLDEYTKNDFVLNIDEQMKGNIDHCIWQKYKPTASEILSPQFRAREATRILKTGAWLCLNETMVWLAPNYYFALAYGAAGANDVEFRLSRLKHVYFKIRARNNPGCKGTLTLKGRGSGETTAAITDALWETTGMLTQQIGIQSKTRGDSINPCWSYVQTLWQTIPQWLKDDLFADMVSGDNIEQKLKFMREADESKGLKARNILFTYYPSGTPMDGKHGMARCLLDEVAKWEECSFYDVFTNYSKFIMPGLKRNGVFDMFSSPADRVCKSNEEVYSLWKDSNPDEITENGTTKSRVHRYYSNPLEGVIGAYDKFGDADPQRIYDWIMGERKKVPKDKLFAEIRGFPLNEKEMFDTPDTESLWDNKGGIESRKIFLIGRRFKDEKTQEPIKVFGNLEWPEGAVDVTDPVFRQSDDTEFNVETGRFAISYMPTNKEPLKMVNTIVNGRSIGERPKPPALIQSCLGMDPFDKRYPGKRFSNGALANWIFRDIYETGIVKCLNLLYVNRPGHNEVFYEDGIKAALFCRSMVQPESINSKAIDYFEDRGYADWMLPKIGQPKHSLIKGDSPSGGKNVLLDEIIGLLNGVTNTPLPFTNDPYLMELNWFYEALDCLSRFNRADTHANDASMAWGQALLGAVKIMYKKVHKKSPLTAGVLDMLLS